MKKWIVDYIWTAWYLVFMLFLAVFTVVLSFVIGQYAATVVGAVFFIIMLVDLCLKIAAFKRFKKRQEEKYGKIIHMLVDLDKAGNH